MKPISLIFFNWRPLPWRFNKVVKDKRHTRAAASSAAGSNGSPSYWEKVKGWKGPLNAALTSASLSATGDVLAQSLIGDIQKGDYDISRTLRMFGYGWFFYGPYQFYWYNLLSHLLPAQSLPNFISKVAANQLLLAPVTLSVVFAWNLGLTGQSEQIVNKIKNDLLPSMAKGWLFWIPAASINFFYVPVERQVLWMSACGVLWTAYLSYISQGSPKLAQVAPSPPPPAVKGKGNK